MLIQEEVNKEIIEMLGTILYPDTTFIDGDIRKELRKKYVALKKDRGIKLTPIEEIWENA